MPIYQYDIEKQLILKLLLTVLLLRRMDGWGENLFDLQIVLAF